MKRRNVFAFTAVFAAAALSLGACSSGGNQSAEKEAEDTTTESGTVENETADGDWTIAIVPKDATNPWFVRMDEGVKRYAEDTGLNVFQRGPAETDATMQAQVIQDLIAQNVDAIGVVPVDPAALEPVLKEARDAGIIVVAHEGASLENIDYDIEAFNNAQYGAFIMDNLAQAMGEKGTYTTMVGHVTNASHNEWADGGVARQKEAYPDMVLLEAEPRVESQDDGETAYQTAKEVMAAYPEVTGIMGTSSFDAPGVARAIEEAGLTGKFFTSGTGMPQANKAILESGAVSALTLWDPADAGYALAALAVHMLKGEPVENGLDLGVDGYTDMQFAEGSDKVLEGAGWIVITKENVDDFSF